MTSSAPTRSHPRPRSEPAPTRPWRLLVAVCLLLALASLLLPSVPTYDPWAWLIWGREILHGELVTITGPSWKPLPVFFTTPFAVLGDDGAPLAWLVIARAGGLLAIAMAYRLGSRLAGPAAGVIAAGALLLSDDFLVHVARGNSEGILVAVSLWAIERHLDRRPMDAFLLGCAAGLLRPEVWPFVAAYGIWLVRSDPTRRTAVLVGGAGMALLVLWFVPEYLGSGDFLRAAERARRPNDGSPAFAEHPFLEVFDRSSSVLTPPVYVGALVAVLLAARRRDRVALALAAGAAVLMVAVATMTEAGFAGNLRYVALPAALVCVLAGTGWVDLAQAAHRWRGATAAIALVVAGVAFAVPSVRDDVDALRRRADTVRDEADVYGSVPDAIAAAGGEQRFKDCPPVFTGAFQTQTVAWYLHLHQDEVIEELEAEPPGTVIAPHFVDLSRDDRFVEIARTVRWVVRTTCVD